MTKRTKKVKAQQINRIARDTLGPVMVPEWTLPRTAADYDAMLVQGSVALYKTEGKRLSRDEVVAAVLRAIGITRPRE